MRLPWNREKRAVFPWNQRYDELAKYNGRKARGLLHEAAYVERMESLQAEYNAELEAWRKEQGMIVFHPGDTYADAFARG